MPVQDVSAAVVDVAMHTLMPSSPPMGAPWVLSPRVTWPAVPGCATKTSFVEVEIVVVPVLK